VLPTVIFLSGNCINAERCMWLGRWTFCFRSWRLSPNDVWDAGQLVIWRLLEARRL